MKRVLLVLPPYPGPSLGPPVGLLCLATPLLISDYEVEIVDAAIVPDFLQAVEHGLTDAICVGISLLTGPMIKGAMTAARLVRRLRPDVPIVFGGWHPSLLPEQTLKESFVDVVVRNQGELTFLELVRRIESAGDYGDVAGCSFKSATKIVHNPDRPIAQLTALPTPAYDLVDFDAYEAASGERKLPYASSVGCPYACSYCTDMVFYRRRFNAQSAQRVVDEVTRIVAKNRLHEVALLDSNFLVDAPRAMEMARGFIAAGSAFSWTFQTSIDLLSRLSDDDMLLLGKSGVRHIGFGVESASDRVLAAMNKRHQRPEHIFETARKCRKAGIRATFNLILGFPGETEVDRRQTLRIMGKVASQFDNVTFSANIFTPYPGIPVWPELARMGVNEPSRLEEWAPLALGANVLPWLQGRVCEDISRNIFLFSLGTKVRKAMSQPCLSRLARCRLRVLQKALHYRMRHDFLRWPIEFWLLDARIGVPRQQLQPWQTAAHNFNVGSRAWSTSL